MKHLSRLDIEAIAEKYITAYMELPEVQDTLIWLRKRKSSRWTILSSV